METIYFPCDPATQSDPSDLAGTLQLSHPGDDYYYGAETHLVWQQTGSIIQTLDAACAGVADSYQIWQGNLFSAFSCVSGTQCIFQYPCLSSGDFRDPAFIVRRYFLSAVSSVPPFSAGNLQENGSPFLPFSAFCVFRQWNFNVTASTGTMAPCITPVSLP